MNGLKRMRLKNLKWHKDKNMNAKFELEIADQNIVVSAFRTLGGTTELFERIAQEARSHVPDVTTKKAATRLVHWQ